VNLVMTFKGPENIRYPQYRADIDSFDETLRVPSNLKAETQKKKKKSKSAKQEANNVLGVADDIMNRLIPTLAPPPEFTEDEILAAFRFIDLDHNNFVGSAEIRHILVCMGELVTDEEIDMMISMIDLDGDGQISLSEFRTVVLHPNPGDVDMHKAAVEDREKQAMNEKFALTNKHSEIEVNVFQRQKEISLRDTKKKMLLSFIEDNDIVFDSIRVALSVLASLPKEKKVNNRLNFDTFCRMLKIEPIGEYRKLFSLFDQEETGSIEIREFILSLMNFISVDKEERIRLAFSMYDEYKSGFIGLLEVQQILKGNHMIGEASVLRKAQTVMKQAAAVDGGAITVEEFVVVSKKFPNILWPVFNHPGGLNAGEQ